MFVETTVYLDPLITYLGQCCQKQGRGTAKSPEGEATGATSKLSE